MSLMTPLNRVLGLGAARGAVEHWWTQRLTAVALVPLGLWFGLSLAGFESLSYAAVAAWVAQPMTGVLLVLTAIAMVHHSYLGVQVVIEDYVVGPAKIAALVLSAFVHAFAAVAAVYSILKVAFGAQ